MDKQYLVLTQSDIEQLDEYLWCFHYSEEQAVDAATEWLQESGDKEAYIFVLETVVSEVEE